jgi:hypothetical protein
MPLRYAPEAPNAVALIRSGLSRLARRERGPLQARAAGVDVQDMQIAPPHAVYDLRADEIARGGGLETARETGVRHLVQSAGSQVAAAELRTDQSGAANVLANVNFGPYVDATSRALNRLASLDQVRTGSYEARLLRFSAGMVMAIWLKPDSGGADIVYPLAPAPPPLEAERPYAAGEFLQAIRPIAEKRAASTSPRSVP